jgi:hypothetical protein
MSSVYQARTEEPPVIRARIDVKPDVLHLRCPRDLIACYVELPEGYRPASIDFSSTRLNRTFSPLRQFAIGDFNNNGIPDPRIMFERAPIVRYIMRSVDITQIMEQGSVTAALSVTGCLNDGTAFRGIDTIRIVVPPIRGAL